MTDFRFDAMPDTGPISEAERLRLALRACWDRYSDLMPDDLYEQVRSALHMFEFTAADVSDIEEGSEFDGPTPV